MHHFQGRSLQFIKLIFCLLLNGISAKYNVFDKTSEIRISAAH
jgi:hypothetical protein